MNTTIFFASVGDEFLLNIFTEKGFLQFRTESHVCCEGANAAVQRSRDSLISPPESLLAPRSTPSTFQTCWRVLWFSNIFRFTIVLYGGMLSSLAQDLGFCHECIIRLIVHLGIVFFFFNILWFTKQISFHSIYIRILNSVS